MRFCQNISFSNVTRSRIIIYMPILVLVYRCSGLGIYVYALLRYFPAHRHLCESRVRRAHSLVGQENSFTRRRYLLTIHRVLRIKEVREYEMYCTDFCRYSTSQSERFSAKVEETFEDVSIFGFDARLHASINRDLCYVTQTFSMHNLHFHFQHFLLHD